MTNPSAIFEVSEIDFGPGILYSVGFVFILLIYSWLNWDSKQENRKIRYLPNLIVISSLLISYTFIYNFFLKSDTWKIKIVYMVIAIIGYCFALDGEPKNKKTANYAIVVFLGVVMILFPGIALLINLIEKTKQ